MPRLYRWTLAGTLALALPALVGFEGNPPQAVEPPTPTLEVLQQALLARDYFFPSSATMRAVYSFSESTQVPSQAAQQMSGTLTVTVVSYSPTQAVVRTTSTSTGEGGQPSTQTADTTLTIEADGTVVSSATSQRRSNDIFTSGGGVVAPASGSEIPEIRARMVGTETVTVPAGTYQTVRLQEGLAAQGAPQYDVWVARGVGIVRKRMDATYTVPTGQNQTAQARTTYEMRLDSFTP